jgi:hypothetical protein
MNSIELKKEEAAFYFNQAELNLKAIESNIFDKQQRMILLNNPRILAKVGNFIFNFKDVTKDAKGEIDCLMLKLTELRNFYSHYVHTDNVKVLSNGERPLLERYYQIAIDATRSEDVKLEIIEENNNKLTDAGVLFFLCMFLKKSQANKIISGISGFKRNAPTGQPRRNLFTYFSVREGYKVLPDMQKHFLLFTLVNNLSNQDEYIYNLGLNQEIGEGAFFHRIASTFLNVSGILRNMKFYSYQSKRLKEQRGEPTHKKDSFDWIEPFQGNSYFEINGHKGVIGEDELKELCYALLVAKKDVRAVEGKITQFMIKYKNADNVQKVETDEMLDEKYFPANYFAKSGVGSIKDRMLRCLEKEAEGYKAERVNVKAYDKMKEVMEFINNSLPANEKLKRKDYRRYLNMVRFWSREKGNISREFEKKEWLKYFPSGLWMAKNLEEVYKLARGKNAELSSKLKEVVEKMNEREFEKYQQINDSRDLESLRRLAQNFGVKWEEKDWEEYAGQIKKQITDRQKLTIMRQRITVGLKKKQGIENLNLRITIDSNKSRKAVLNRIAIPRGFVKRHILSWLGSEKVSKKTREAGCKILLSKKYEELSGQFFEERNFEKMTQINSLYEKNKLIALMAVYLMERLNIQLNEHTELDGLNKTRVDFKISDKVKEKIPFSQYPSLVYAMSSKYADSVDNYKFSDENKKKPFLVKIDKIEKERMEFIKEVLGFEKHLFDNSIIDRKRFSDTATHINFEEIRNELIKKGWDNNKLTELKDARNKALHGEIPEGTSFQEAKMLIDGLKNI